MLRFIGAWSQNDSIWSLLVGRCQCFAVVSKREGSQQIEQAALPSEEMPLLLRPQIHDVSRIDQYLLDVYYMYYAICIYLYIIISLVANFFPGQILIWFLSILCRFAHFKIKMTISRKKCHFMFSFLSDDESARVFLPFSRVFPPFSRVFPPFSREFPPRKIDTFLRKVE